MKQITEKENFMMFIRGQHPHWVPRYGIGPDPYAKHPPAVLGVSPGFLSARRTPEGGYDLWGVRHVVSEDISGAAIPAPNEFMLTDVRKWREAVVAPSLDGLDWEAMAKKDMAHIDRENTAVSLSFHVGYFQQLMAFMGFSEGLCAMFEEPDEVRALFQYMADFFAEVSEKAIEHYRPDVIEILDDTATARNPFISAEMFRELVKPYHAQQAEPAIRAGIPVVMHNCGRCEDFIEDWFDYGVVAWNPAQVMNDLDGIKKKYGRRLGLMGCWDSAGPVNWPDVTEEFLRAEVRRTIDRFAPGGGFCFWGSTYGPVGDAGVENRKRWMTDEYEKYGRTFYEKNG